jgi:hypothetical protein
VIAPANVNTDWPATVGKYDSALWIAVIATNCIFLCFLFVVRGLSQKLKRQETREMEVWLEQAEDLLDREEDKL